MAKARSALVLEKIFRRAIETREAFDEQWAEMEGLEGDGTERIEERRKGKLPTRVPLYANRLDKLEDSLKREVRKMNTLKDELTKWLQENPRSDSDRRERAEEWIKVIVDKIHGFHRNFRETKIRKIAAGDEVDVERTELSDESMMEWLDKSNDDLKALIEKAENEAQDAESRAKGKREKKQIKEREEKRQKYLEYHVDQLQLLHRMLAVKLVTAEQISDLEDMVRDVLSRQGLLTEGLDEEEEQYEMLTGETDLAEIEALESEAALRAKERKKEDRAAELQRQKEEQRGAAALQPEEKRANRVRTIAPSQEQQVKQPRETRQAAAKGANHATSTTPANGKQEKKEPMRHPCVHQNGHCQAGDACQYAMFEASVCVMQLRFGTCRGSKDGRCIWDHPRNPKPLPLPGSGLGSNIIAASAISTSTGNVWGNSKVVMAAIGADTAKPTEEAPQPQPQQQPAEVRRKPTPAEREREKERREAEEQERLQEEQRLEKEREREKEEAELARQAEQQQQQRAAEEKERKLAEEQKRIAEEEALAEAKLAQQLQAAHAEAEPEAAAITTTVAAAVEAVKEESNEAAENLLIDQDAHRSLARPSIFPPKWDEPQDEGVSEPVSSCNSENAQPMSDLASLISKSERSESRQEDLPPLEAVCNTLLSSLWTEDITPIGSIAPSEATETNHDSASSKTNGVIADGGAWTSSPSWRPVASSGLFSGGGKWGAQTPRACQTPVASLAATSQPDHTAELERLRKENEALRGRAAEVEKKDQELRAHKEMLKMLQQERDQLQAKVKSLGSQLRAIRKEEYYPNGEYGAKREEGMFDLANEWPSPNSDMHEEFSEDPNSRRIQQKIFQAMREATTAVLKETRSDIEGMAVQDGRHQREKKPFLSKTERGGYPNNKRSKLHSAGMRYQHEMMEPPQDPQGYAMDPAAVHYPFLPMVRGHYGA